jgi:hypothetical protein
MTKVRRQAGRIRKSFRLEVRMPLTLRFAFRLLAASLLAVAVTCAPALAEDKEQKQNPPASSELTPSGKIDFVYGQAAFILSGSGGKGTLTFNKKKYEIKLGGLGIGGIGGSKVTASGQVYNLRTLADFPGAYVQGRMGYAFGEGKGTLWLENTNGVVLKLKAKTKGLALSLGGDGLIIEFAQKKK